MLYAVEVPSLVILNQTWYLYSNLIVQYTYCKPGTQTAEYSIFKSSKISIHFLRISLSKLDVVTVKKDSVIFILEIQCFCFTFYDVRNPVEIFFLHIISYSLEFLYHLFSEMHIWDLGVRYG